MTPYQVHIQIAVALSLLLHALAFGVYQLRGVAASLQGHTQRRSTAAAAPALPEQRMPTISFVERPRPAREETRPQVFVETDDRQPRPDQAEPTPFYSNRATAAANPENPTQVVGETPYLAGTDSKTMSTEDVPVPSPGAMAISQKRIEQVREAAAAPPQPPAPAGPTDVPPTGLKQVKPGEPQPEQLAMVSRPSRPGAAEPVPPEPATPPGATGISFPGRDIASRRAKLTASGVSRTGVAAFNVAESPFGEYDRRLIRAVQQRWYMLIEKYGVYERAGTVTLYFQLYEDGTIRNLQRKENSAGEILALYCEKAVSDAAPFEALTDNLRRLVGDEPRDVNFTFYY